MSRTIARSALRLLSLILALALVLGVFTVARDQGWLAPFGVDSESRDSQVIQAIERTQAVGLVRLNIQGINEERRNSEIFGKEVPGTGKLLFLQYNLKAKLGIDGEQVKVTRSGGSTYRITVPEFILIGYDDPTFKVAVEDDGALSFVTDDIDESKAITEILSDDAQQEYVSSNEDILQDQTRVFYDSLIKSIDSAAVTEYEFQS